MKPISDVRAVRLMGRIGERQSSKPEATVMTSTKIYVVSAVSSGMVLTAFQWRDDAERWIEDRCEELKRRRDDYTVTIVDLWDS